MLKNKEKEAKSYNDLWKERFVFVVVGAASGGEVEVRFIYSRVGKNVKAMRHTLKIHISNWEFITISMRLSLESNVG